MVKAILQYSAQPLASAYQSVGTVLRRRTATAAIVNNVFVNI